MLDSISTSHPGGAGQVVGTYSYTWDNNRNKTAESISGVMSGYGFSSSTFDNDDRLTAWNRTDGNQDQSWNLSATGNWPGSAR